MSTNILCAVDLAHPKISRKILSEAARMADEGATISVITVLPDYGMSIVGSYFEEGMMDKAITSANEALHGFVRENLVTGAKLRHIVSIGSAYEEVLKTATDLKVDLIVIGASKPDLKDYLLGPNASRVARHAEVSVYIIRQ